MSRTRFVVPLGSIWRGRTWGRVVVVRGERVVIPGSVERFAPPDCNRSNLGGGGEPEDVPVRPLARHAR